MSSKIAKYWKVEVLLLGEKKPGTVKCYTPPELNCHGFYEMHLINDEVTHLNSKVIHELTYKPVFEDE